jgi:hypothetical protein
MNNVHNINDHMALTCDCGSARFALLRSDGIECHGCGKRHPFVWRELDAQQRQECAGLGRVGTDHRVDNSGFTLPSWDSCDACEGLGWVGPEAEQQAALEHRQAG